MAPRSGIFTTEMGVDILLLWEFNISGELSRTLRLESLHCFIKAQLVLIPSVARLLSQYDVVSRLRAPADTS